MFHNATLFGSCIIHILHTGCANIKKNSGAKVLKTKIQDARQFMKFRNAISHTMQTPGQQVRVDYFKTLEEFVSYGNATSRSKLILFLTTAQVRTILTNLAPRLLRHSFWQLEHKSPCLLFFIPVELRPTEGHGFLINEFSRSHKTTHHR
jgi:hypothetical protein